VTGEILDRKAMYMSVHVGSASDSGHQYEDEHAEEGAA